MVSKSVGRYIPTYTFATIDKELKAATHIVCSYLNKMAFLFYSMKIYSYYGAIFSYLS